jgi:hypothetical protein
MDEDHEKDQHNRHCPARLRGLCKETQQHI